MKQVLSLLVSQGKTHVQAADEFKAMFDKAREQYDLYSDKMQRVRDKHHKDFRKYDKYERLKKEALEQERLARH